MTFPQASFYTGKDGSDSLSVDDVPEQLDQEINDAGDFGIDVIIDTVWWMFSTTYARCYAYFYPVEDIILLFFQMFQEDFLDQFLTRW